MVAASLEMKCRATGCGFESRALRLRRCAEEQGAVFCRNLVVVAQRVRLISREYIEGLSRFLWQEATKVGPSLSGVACAAC